MDMVPAHLLEAAGVTDVLVVAVVGAVDHGFGDVVGGDGDGDEEGGGVDGDAVALVGADDPV